MTPKADHALARLHGNYIVELHGPRISTAHADLQIALRIVACGLAVEIAANPSAVHLERAEDTFRLMVGVEEQDVGFRGDLGRDAILGIGIGFEHFLELRDEFGRHFGKQDFDDFALAGPDAGFDRIVGDRRAGTSCRRTAILPPQAAADQADERDACRDADPQATAARQEAVRGRGTVASALAAAAGVPVVIALTMRSTAPAPRLQTSRSTDNR